MPLHLFGFQQQSVRRFGVTLIHTGVQRPGHSLVDLGGTDFTATSTGGKPKKNDTLKSKMRETCELGCFGVVSCDHFVSLLLTWQQRVWVWSWISWYICIKPRLQVYPTLTLFNKTISVDCWLLRLWTNLIYWRLNKTQSSIKMLQFQFNILQFIFCALKSAPFL